MFSEVLTEHSSSSYTSASHADIRCVSCLVPLLTLGIFLLVPLAHPLASAIEDILGRITRAISPLLLVSLLALAIAPRVKQYYPQILRTIRQTKPLVRLVIACSSSIAIWLVDSPIEAMHIIIYGTLGFYAASRLRSERRFGASVWLTTGASIMLCFLVGLSDEILQLLHPTRVFDIRDLFLNLFSSITGACVSHACYSLDCRYFFRYSNVLPTISPVVDTSAL